MSGYKITYFDSSDRAEVPRLILVKNGVKFEDIRLSFEEWPAFKEKSKDRLPFGQLPTLEVDGKILHQSPCITRLLGKRFGMYGKDEFEECKVGAVHLTMEDLCKIPFDVQYEIKNEEVKAEMSAKFKETLPTQMKYLEKMVEKSGYFVGDSMTVADLAFFVYIDFVHMIKDVIINWSDYPKLKGVCEKVKSDPKIAEWVKKHAKS